MDHPKESLGYYAIAAHEAVMYCKQIKILFGRDAPAFNAAVDRYEQYINSLKNGDEVTVVSLADGRRLVHTHPKNNPSSYFSRPHSADLETRTYRQVIRTLARRR